MLFPPTPPLSLKKKGRNFGIKVLSPWEAYKIIYHKQFFPIFLCPYKIKKEEIQEGTSN